MEPDSLSEVLKRQLADKAGGHDGSFIKSGTWVRPEKRPDYLKMISRAQNFFKHAARDADCHDGRPHPAHAS